MMAVIARILCYLFVRMPYQEPQVLREQINFRTHQLECVNTG